MYQKYLGEKFGWVWTPFDWGSCDKSPHTGLGWVLTPFDWGSGDKTGDNTGQWAFHSLPNAQQIESVTCREYTDCWEEFGDDDDEISDPRITKSCEHFPGLEHIYEHIYTCKR